MLEHLKREAAITHTENGALTYNTSQSSCLDLFFRAGAMRDTPESEVAAAVKSAYEEDPERALKIVFFARDIREGLGERRFFRIAARTLAAADPAAVKRNLPLIAEYGRYDDICALLGTSCEEEAVRELKSRLDADREAMAAGGQVSLLAKWLPSVNTSSPQARAMGRKLAKLFGMTEKEYRQTLSALRKYIDILENRLRESDYTFDYSKQPSGAMLKYRQAFIRNDSDRYWQFLSEVESGKKTLHADTLFPYDIVRKCIYAEEPMEKAALDAAWKSLPAYGTGTENAIAVIDCSGSMTCGYGVRPIDAALSLGIYFAEHSTGRFAGHFITFSDHPRLVEISGRDITSKVEYILRYEEYANTDLEAVFQLILRTAVKNSLPAEELPSKLYIISDMEFDYCIEGGNSLPMFDSMRRLYAKHGYALPEIVFWNVNSHGRNIPVTVSETGAALVSGFSPAIFDMVASGDLSPFKVMDSIIYSERYAVVG